MDNLLAGQTIQFLSALLLGGALSLFYDVFRIFRLAIKNATVAVFLQDILYFFLCGIISFFFIITVTEGVIRVVLIVGELLGWLLIHFTVGELIMKISGAIIAAIAWVFGFIFRWLISPILQVLKSIHRFAQKKTQTGLKTLKKSKVILKYNLKRTSALLYNALYSPLRKVVVEDVQEEGQSEDT